MQLRQIPLEFLLGPLSRAPLASAAHYQRSEIVFSSAKLSQRHGSQSMSLTLFGPLLFSFALLSGRQRPFPLHRHYLSLSLSLSLSPSLRCRTHRFRGKEKYFPWLLWRDKLAAVAAAAAAARGKNGALPVRAGEKKRKKKRMMDSKTICRARARLRNQRPRPTRPRRRRRFGFGKDEESRCCSLSLSLSLFGAVKGVNFNPLPWVTESSAMMMLNIFNR